MTEAIQKAATWLATTPERQRPAHLVPHLRKAFGLSAAEAVQAIREAHLIRARAA